MLIRIDDYPNGVRPNSYWSGKNCGFNDEWEEHNFQIGLVLREFEDRGVPYIMGVVPSLIEERDIEYLKNLKYCTVALHGYDHANVIFRQIVPKTEQEILLHGGWVGVDNEFHPRFRKSKQTIVKEFEKGLELLSHFKVKHFIAPFNHMTQEAVDAVIEVGMTDIWWCGNWNYKNLNVLDPGLYEKSENMLTELVPNRNITFHLTWELEQFKKHRHNWKLPKILDNISRSFY